MTSILFWPDPHTKPGMDNITRFIAVGNLSCEQQVDHEVLLGDHFDFPSLSRFDEGMAAMEGRVHMEDIEAGQTALDAFQSAIDANNKNRKRKYEPNKEFMEGNHEWRQEVWLSKYPKFRETFGLHSLGLAERGWNVTRYRQKLDLCGFVIRHHFTNRMGKPLTSENNIGNIIYQKYSVSGIQGHNHLLQVAWNTDAKGKKYFSGSLGWFGALGQVEDYAKDSQDFWWNGVVLMKNVEDGYGDPEFFTQERLLKEYT